jgi:hypothetical protein
MMAVNTRPQSMTLLEQAFPAGCFFTEAAALLQEQRKQQTAADFCTCAVQSGGRAFIIISPYELKLQKPIYHL